MKFIFALLPLFALSGTASAEPALNEHAGSNGKCQEMYRTYLNDAEAGSPITEQQLLNYANMCIPQSAHQNNPRYFKLLQRINNERPVVTIQASLHSVKPVIPIS